MRVFVENERNDEPTIGEYYSGKSVFITGGTGLSEYNRALVMQNTNIIIHSAATVRFDESLKEPHNINVLGALRLIELAQEVHNLESYVHVSTAYCNLDYEEKIQKNIPTGGRLEGDKGHSGQHGFRSSTDLDTKVTGQVPHFSYVFTKNLAEHVVYEYRGKLPIVIVRPSIVTGCLSEPCPGWIDNFNGPTGLLTAAEQGILRAVFSDEDIKSDYVPADVVVKGTLVAAWVRGTEKEVIIDSIVAYSFYVFVLWWILNTCLRVEFIKE